MGKVSKKRRRTPTKESPKTAALTTMWMVTILTALACEIAFIASAIVAHGRDSNVFAMLSLVLLFAALVTGLLGLLLTPAVLRMRRPPPPRAITILALIVGIAPLAILVWQVLD